MKFIEEKDSLDCDKGVKNVWKWTWLSETCDDVLIGQWCKKIDIAGSCFCIACNQVIVYGSSGKKVLFRHAKKPDHIASFKASHANPKLYEKLNKNKSHLDAVAEVKARTCLFLAENTLPFTLAPSLIKFAKSVSQNSGALKDVSMEKTCATYTLSHGIAHSLKNDLSQSLKDTCFSLNVDEATNNSGTKILNVLVQYFSEGEQKILVELLGSREISISNSQNIAKAIENILEERGLSITQVVSITMDNCNVMRGNKNGVEAKLRQENEHLLDVSGDTVHMLNIAVKKFFSVLESDFLPLQEFCSNLYYDIEDSPKAKSLFNTIQTTLYGKNKTIKRPIPTRFNQMLDVVERVLDLWDALLMYYSAFLDKSEQHAAVKVFDDICLKRSISEDGREKITEALKKLKVHTKTDANKCRKENIILYLRNKQPLTMCALLLLKGILKQFQDYIKLFQNKKPLAHRLHVEMFKVFKEFFSGFIMSDKIPMHNAKQLFSLPVDDQSIQVKDRHLAVGEFCHPFLMICLRNKQKHQYWLNTFFSALRKAYQQAALSMKKMPLLNKALIALSSLDPCNQRSSTTLGALMSLAEQLPNVVNPSELGKLDYEIRKYTLDDDISMLPADEDSSDFRIDEDWWVPIFSLDSSGSPRYPILSKLVKSLLSIFSGPLVESSFNIMDDIITEDRSRMTTFNYEALAMVKSHLDSRGKSSIDMDIPERMIKGVQTSYMRYSNATASSKAKNEQSTNTIVKHDQAPATSIIQEKLKNNATNSSTHDQPIDLTAIIPDKSNQEPLAQPPEPQSSSTTQPLNLNQCQSIISTPNDQPQTQTLKRKQQSTLAGFFSKKPRT